MRCYYSILPKQTLFRYVCTLDTHTKLNREVRHSLTCHSSKSESVLKRFEPVAVVKLRLDGTLAMFAPEGDGCLHRVKLEDTGRFSKEGKPSF